MKYSDDFSMTIRFILQSTNYSSLRKLKLNAAPKSQWLYRRIYRKVVFTKAS